MIAYRTHSRRILLGVSATTYLTLGIKFGPHVAFLLVVAAALVAGFVWLVRHHPIVAYGVISFIRGLVGR